MNLFPHLTDSSKASAVLHGHLVTSTFVAQKNIVGLYLKKCLFEGCYLLEKDNQVLFSIPVVFLCASFSLLA